MLAKINSASLYGIDALRVEVEVDIASGLPQ
ncbi:MAG: ATP-binding protein, partial [Deltaproteobacteria bacterium]|nr:ATP-binding protein [Deltaproteobacteria bacterium]